MLKMILVDNVRRPTVSSSSIRGFYQEYSFLSNFYELDEPIILDDIEYSSVEHAYVASKTDSLSEKLMIAALKSPKEAKKAGRSIKLRPDWERIKLDVMLKLVRLKFQQVDLKTKLLATNFRYLEETNNWKDRFWGVCDGVGLNALGFILMTVRDEL